MKFLWPLLMLILALTGGGAHAQSAWQQCVSEGGTCTPGSYPAEVRYGEPWGDKWSVPKTVTAPIACSNASFGDPSPGTGKRCEWRTSAAPQPQVPLRVTWVHATQNTDGSALTDRTGYRVERAAQETGPWSGWVTVAASATVATGQVPAGRNCVRVATIAQTGESAPTTAVCVIKNLAVLPKPPTNVRGE